MLNVIDPFTVTGMAAMDRYDANRGNSSKRNMLTYTAQKILERNNLTKKEVKEVE